jgi:hypothetical protein
MNSRYSLGIGISSNSVRVVLVRRGQLRWAREAKLSDVKVLEVALTELLSCAPLRHFLKPSAFVALGPDAAWVKVLPAFPRLHTRALMLQALKTNAPRFFPQEDPPRLIATVDVDENECVWGVSVREDVLDAVLEACRKTRIRVRGFAPTVTVLGETLRKENSAHSIVWPDGAITTVVAFMPNGSLSSVRLRRESATWDTHPDQTTGLIASVPGEFALADALGAALLGRNAKLSFQPAIRRAQNGSEPVISRLRIGIATCSVLVVVSLASSVVAPTYQRLRDESRLATISHQADEAATAAMALSKQGITLRAVDQFYVAGPSPTLILHRLSEAIPAGVAIISLRFDSAGGTLVLLGERVIRTLELVDSLPEISETQVATPLTRETLNGREVERLALRFAFRVTKDSVGRPERIVRQGMTQ